MKSPVEMAFDIAGLTDDYLNKLVDITGIDKGVLLFVAGDIAKHEGLTVMIVLGYWLDIAEKKNGRNQDE